MLRGELKEFSEMRITLSLEDLAELERTRRIDGLLSRNSGGQELPQVPLRLYLGVAFRIESLPKGSSLQTQRAYDVYLTPAYLEKVRKHQLKWDFPAVPLSHFYISLENGRR